MTWLLEQVNEWLDTARFEKFVGTCIICVGALTFFTIAGIYLWRNRGES